MNNPDIENGVNILASIFSSQSTEATNHANNKIWFHSQKKDKISNDDIRKV